MASSEIKILVRNANGEEIYETNFEPDYGTPQEHARAILEGIFGSEAFSDLEEKRWYTEDGENAIVVEN